MKHYKALKKNGQSLEVYPDRKNIQKKISNEKKKGKL